MLEAGEMTEPTEMVKMLGDAIEDRIAEFNRARGRRKALDPVFTEEVPDFITTRCLKFGSIYLYPDRADNFVSDLASATVLTLLHVRPRPEKVNFNVITRDGQLRYRLLVYKPRRSRKELPA